MPELLQGTESERLRRRAADLAEAGIPRDFALHAAGLLDGFSLLDVCETARAAQVPAAQVAPLYFALSERFEVDRMLTRITELPRGDRWQSLARAALRYDLYAALAGLTYNVLTTTAVAPAPERIAAWENDNAEGLARARGTLDEILSSETSDLATLSVALRTIRTLLRS